MTTRRVSAGRWALGTSLSRTLLLIIAREVQTVGAIGYVAVIGSMPMLRAAVTKGRVAGPFVTLEQVMVCVPAFSPLIITTPSTLFYRLSAVF
jgi:hypothetical protein